MAVAAIYAGASEGSMVKLPSPTAVKPSRELIWSENTGRAQSGSNKAKMIGDTVAEKATYNIEWGVITTAEYNTIREHLTKGFFYFGIGTKTSPPSSPKKFYRGTISGEMIQAGREIFYKDVSVSVIEQ